MLCVVSHDSGGAELLASYVARHGISCEFVLGGPALNVFERRIGNISPIKLESALVDCDEFLTGTSWESDLELKAVAAARTAGKPTTSFIDHWGHYRERFIRDGVECLPDILWVGDRIAENLARKTFPTTPVQLVLNPYFEDIREALPEIESSPTSRAVDGLRVLYICEPIGAHELRVYGDESHWGFDEFDALRYFFENRAALGQPLFGLVIRPHPSEASGKYDQIADEFGKITRIGGKKSLLQEIVDSDVVVGCESMAMVVGLIAGRRVISSIPPGARHQCSLPMHEIESLQNLVTDARDNDLWGL